LEALFVRRVFGDQRAETVREISKYAVALKSYSTSEDSVAAAQ
jgi:hypothetical protein